MRAERTGHSLQATALVNEAYLRLMNVRQVNWQDRAHFLAMAARMMRRILVEFARARIREKRGGGAMKVSLAEGLLTTEKDDELVALDDALDALAELTNERAWSSSCDLPGFECRGDGEALAVSPETIMRDWKFSKAWLRNELRRGETSTNFQR